MSMLSSLGPSGDSKHRTGVHARQIPVEAHQGDRHAYLCRHELAASQASQLPRSQQEPFLATLLDRVADTRTLKLAFERLQRRGGQSPGPNGLRYDDLDHFEVWDMIEALSQSIKDGSYRPGPTRAAKIPKASGGTRTLTLANIEDRVVAKAVLLVIQPLQDPAFNDCSFGSRPGRDRIDALARAKYHAEVQGHWIWVVEDVKSAFDNIPFHRLMNLLQKQLPDDLCELIARLVRRTVDGRITKRGIQQGNALAPLLLNVYLDHHLDRVWGKKFPDLPLLRTVDDILVTVSDEVEVHRVRHRLRDILVPAGLPIQDTKSQVANLANEESTVWLGYQLCQQDNVLDIQIPESSWKELENAFDEVHTSPFPSLQVDQCVCGWLEQLGPVYPYHVQIIPRIYDLASRYGHEELPCEDVFTDILERAYEKWLTTYREQLQNRAS